MAHLIQKQLLAAGEQELHQKAPICQEAQAKFFEAHLAWWVPAFAGLLGREVPSGAYKAIARALACYVPCERDVLGVRPVQNPGEPKTELDPEGDEQCCAMRMKILVPVDFSPRSSMALRYAAHLACRFHSELTLLHVLNSNDDELSAEEATDSRIGELSQVWRRRAKDLLANSPPGDFRCGNVRCVVLSGSPARAFFVGPQKGTAPAVSLLFPEFARANSRSR